MPIGYAVFCCIYKVNSKRMASALNTLLGEGRCHVLSIRQAGGVRLA